MLIVGISWLLYWALIVGVNVEATKAAAITGLIFVFLGVVLGERPWDRRP